MLAWTYMPGSSLPWGLGTSISVRSVRACGSGSIQAHPSHHVTSGPHGGTSTAPAGGWPKLPGPNGEQATLNWTEWVLVGAGLVGFGLAGLGHVYGPSWLIGAGLLLAGVSAVWLAVIVQPGPHPKTTKDKTP